MKVYSLLAKSLRITSQLVNSTGRTMKSDRILEKNILIQKTILQRIIIPLPNIRPVKRTPRLLKLNIS